MNNFDSVFAKVQTILKDIIGNKDLNITPENSSTDIAGWDSIVHIEFIISLENEFGIKFTSSEMAQFTTIKEICESILQKISK